MKILRKLDAWQKAGLLDGAQVASIARYEEEHAGGTQWAVWGIGSVGALAITTGIVSVISANWDVVPTWLKLLASVTLVLGAVAGAWRTASLASTWPRDIFLFVHDGLTLATVGLVAQVYHLHGHAWRAPALCAALALPAAVIATRGLLTYVVLGHVSVASYLLLDEVGWTDGDGLALRFFAAAFGLTLLGGARILAAAREASASALQRWGLAVLSFLAVHACVAWSDSGGWRSASAPRIALYVGVVVFVLAVAGHVVLDVRTPGTGRGNRMLALALFVFLLVGGAILSATNTSSGSSDILGRQLVGFAAACALCIALALAASHAGSRAGTNLATLALAARILALYFELARDLMTTGAGLIVTGAVFLAIAYGWWRLRRILPVAPTPEAGAA